MTQPQAAARFGVSVSTVERYLARRRATGSLARPSSGTGRRRRSAAAARLAAGPLHTAADATLAEHVAAFAEAEGIEVSLASMSRAIAGLPPISRAALTLTGRRRRPGPAAEAKTLSATERDENARAAWREQMAVSTRAGWCSSTSAARTPR
jgi:DNA-directed RNA polymerase specialized sigma24 family protein